MELRDLSTLSDRILLAEVARLAGCERELTTELVAHLAEMDSRRLHLAAGFPSLFAYCTDFLRLSEYEAFNRIEAARAARRFPNVLRMLTSGALTLTTAQLLGRHLTDENHGTLLAAAAGKSKMEVQELIARLHPQPDVRASVRKLPVPTVAPPATVATASPTDAGKGPSVSAAQPPRHKPPVTPLSTDRYQFSFTSGRETRELLERARDMLRHAIPDGDTGEIMKRALKLLVRDLERKRFAASSPRKSAGPKDPQDISASVTREVATRDRGRCQYTATSGKTCGTRAFVERHHAVARARGGLGTAQNIGLRCRSHNDYEAERDFGERRPVGEWDTRETSPTCSIGASRSGTSTPPAPAGP